MEKILAITNIIVGLVAWGAIIFFGRKCPSWLGTTRCSKKRGHTGNHNGQHWSGKTIYWRELDTNHLQALLNAIRKHGETCRDIARLHHSKDTWERVEELTAEIQSSIDGTRTTGR
jgi:hypothetical protein